MKRGIIETSIRAGDTLRTVRCEFATPREVRELAKWKVARPGNAGMVDAVEYAGLTCKRWGFYLEEGRAVTDAHQLRDPAIADADELAFLIVARAQWAEPTTLGLCLFRRSWCNHLIVDFLAVHPNFQEGGEQPLKGIGAALLLSVTEIATLIGAKRIWGEATRGSAAKYERFFLLKNVRDLFVVNRKGYIDFGKRFLIRSPETRLLLRQKPSISPL